VNQFLTRLSRALCLILIVASFGNAYGAEEKWSSEVIGEAYIEGNMTAEEANNLCLNRAKAKAIEEIAGTSLLREVFVVDYIKTADFIRAQTNAWVKEYKIIKWDNSEGIQKTPESPPLTMRRVHLKALVVVDKEGSSDFTLKLKLNADVFRDGDEMIISIKPSQDCYLTVFSFLPDENDKVMVLVPSKYQEHRFVKKGSTYTIPDRESIGSQRKLKMNNTTGKPVTREAILALATLYEVDLIDGDFVTANLTDNKNSTGLFRDLLEKMMGIPPRERAMDIQYYEIRGKKKRPMKASS